MAWFGIRRFLKDDDKYFRSCASQITARNRQMLRKGCVLYAMVLLFYTLLTLATDQPAVLLRMYYAFDAIHLMLCAYVFLALQKKPSDSQTIQFACAALEMTVLGFFALEGGYAFPNQHSLYVPIALLLVLLLFTHRPLYTGLVTIGYLASYVILSCVFKTPETYMNDIYIAIATLCAGVIGYTLIAQMRHSEGEALLGYERLSKTDELTGLLNKGTILRICDAMLADAGTPCAFMILDLDNFKHINDRFGHDVGDEVLCSVGDVIRRSFRDTDCAGRFGGDEFIVLVSRCPEKQLLIARAKAIVDQISRLTFSQRDLSVQCSVGIALRRENDSRESIFKRADEALYEAKNGGKGRYVLL